MNRSNIHFKRALALALFSIVLPLAGEAWAESDMEIQEKALKARELNHMSESDHAGHGLPEAASGKFRGVFYGYLPCHEADCNGIKMTLSLNAKNNYLLVIQPAKAQNRESFEKGKYEWDESQQMVVLTPYKDAPQRRLAVKDAVTLLYLSTDGGHLTGDQDRYLMRRSDLANNREMHIH